LKHFRYKLNGLPYHRCTVVNRWRTKNQWWLVSSFKARADS